jgi:hypothetical protein
VACSTTCPPERSRRVHHGHGRDLVQPGADDELRGRGGQCPARPVDAVEVAPVVARGREQPRGGDPRAEVLGHLEPRGERLLHEERDPALDEQRLGRSVCERRYADVHRVGRDRVEQLRKACEGGAPGRPGQRRCGFWARIGHAGERDVRKLRQDGGVPLGDTAGPDEGDAGCGHGRAQ